MKIQKSSVFITGLMCFVKMLMNVLRVECGIMVVQGKRRCKNKNSTSKKNFSSHMFNLIMDFYDPDFYNVKQGRVILRCITLIIRRHSAFFLTFFISLVFLIMYCLYIVVYGINWRSIIFDFGTHDSPVLVKLRMFIFYINLQW